MNIEQAIQNAENVLPGSPAPDNATDERWQCIIALTEFIETHPDEVFTFALRWGDATCEDLRAAIATCLLEHLIAHDPSNHQRWLEQSNGDVNRIETLNLCWIF